MLNCLDNVRVYNVPKNFGVLSLNADILNADKSGQSVEARSGPIRAHGRTDRV